MREGTARTALGKLRPGIARSPLRAGCFSHLQKPYGRRWGTDSGKRIPPSAPHTFFTGPHAGPSDPLRNRVPEPPGFAQVRSGRTPAR
ncbi:hypothetical protein GCM10010433_77020 [Streptomyces pulveraceus]